MCGYHLPGIKQEDRLQTIENRRETIDLRHEIKEMSIGS